LVGIAICAAIDVKSAKAIMKKTFELLKAIKNVMNFELDS